MNGGSLVVSYSALWALQLLGCAASSAPNTPRTAPDGVVASPASAAVASPVAPSAAPSSVSSVAPKPEAHPEASASEVPVLTHTDGLLGVDDEPPPDRVELRGFGPPEGSTEEFGMVNLLDQPPVPMRKHSPKPSQPK